MTVWMHPGLHWDIRKWRHRWV